MFDFWFDLPPLLRAGLGLVMMIMAGVIWFASGGTLYAVGLADVGFFLIVFSRAGDSGGYNF